MPAIRTKLIVSKPVVAINKVPKHDVSSTPKHLVAVSRDPQDLSTCSMEYPLGEKARSTFSTKDGKKVTAHQWAVYDFALTIPCGRVTTYKDLCLAIGEGSPRSVGSALRKNPFAPFVPCHRVIASNLYIGGFYGEWGMGDRRQDDDDDARAEVDQIGRGGKHAGRQCQQKVEMLAMEGVGFMANGYLADECLIWRG
ncbi:6-O-methylguanine DNA methyltransferase [Melanogaster broomeanus]|nr:6-O-methylguanine DNA methyltransferase [Melanogaster broomeanus]